MERNRIEKLEDGYKVFMVTYTEDFGETYHKVFINAKTFTDAYVKVDLKLKENGAIVELFEII